MKNMINKIIIEDCSKPNHTINSYFCITTKLYFKAKIDSAQYSNKYLNKDYTYKKMNY